MRQCVEFGTIRTPLQTGARILKISVVLVEISCKQVGEELSREGDVSLHTLA